MSKRWSRRTLSLLILFGLLAAYLSNGGLTPAADSAPNMYLALSIRHDGDMTFDPTETPLLFQWRVRLDSRTRDVGLSTFDAGMEEWVARGALEVKEGRYLVVPSIREGTYISTFPMGTALTALPFLSLVEIFAGDLRYQPASLWYASKVLAALCVAASAVLIFWTGCRFTSQPLACLITIAYGLGTSVWTTSSQGLWQHGPTELFLALSVFVMTDDRHRARNAALCGLCLGAATLCRPTCGLFVLAVGAYYLWTCRPALLLFISAGMPFAIALFTHNAILLGDPWAFGETKVLSHALEKTGQTSMFSTPPWTGAGVSLFSPSRGLFVFSPFLAFALAAIPRIWRGAAYARLRPWTAGVFGVWLVQFSYFDYWGGWTFGNRTLVDTTPLLSVFLCVVIADLWQANAWRRLFLASVAWSILIQTLGAFFYDTSGWNNRRAFQVRRADGSPPTIHFDQKTADEHRERGAQVTELFLDVDRPENRARLWSIVDSQIPYYLTRLGESRRRRAEFSHFFTRDRETMLAEDYLAIGNGFLELGDMESARRCASLAASLAPGHAGVTELVGKIDAHAADAERR